MKKTKRITSGIISLFIIAGVSVDVSELSRPNPYIPLPVEYALLEDENDMDATAHDKKKSGIKQKPLKYKNDVNNGKNYRDYFKAYYRKTGVSRETFSYDKKLPPKYADNYKDIIKGINLRKNRNKIS